MIFFSTNFITHVKILTRLVIKPLKAWLGFWLSIMEAYLPNASIIIDKYHFIRYVTWAIEKIRKRLNLNENVFSR